jgi:ABC-type xylose transport system permease subunit
MNTLWFISIIVSASLLLACCVVPPLRFRRGQWDNQSIRMSIRSLRVLRLDIIVGEILLLAAFVYLYRRLNHEILLPCTLMLISATVAARLYIGRAIEALKTKLETSGSQKGSHLD